MGWINNRLLRGASNRAFGRLAAEYGPGPATGALAVAIGHACYPDAKYGDAGFQDAIIAQLKSFTPRPCDAKQACQHTESWLDRSTFSTVAVFEKIWGMAPDQFLEKFFAGFEVPAS